MQSGYRVHEWGGDLAWEDLPETEPGEGEVAVDVEACGVGLTVLNCINGDLSDDPALLPRVPGHELVGRVVAAGPGTDHNLVGRRVVAYFYLSCGTCGWCSAGEQARCERLAGWVGVHIDGGYARRAVLPAINAVPVPDDLEPVAATVVPDAVATPVHVCGRRAGVTVADRVVVIGAGGGVGAHMIQVARLHGAQVAGLDVADDKLAEIEVHGARAFDSSDFAAVDPDGVWTDGRATVVIDLVGSPSSLRWSADALGTGARLVVLTTFPDRELPVDPRELVFRESTLLGSRYASRAEVVLAARLVASGRIRPVIGETVGPPDVPALHDALRRGELLGRGAVAWS